MSGVYLQETESGAWVCGECDETVDNLDYSYCPWCGERIIMLSYLQCEDEFLE